MIHYVLRVLPVVVYRSKSVTYEQKNATLSTFWKLLRLHLITVVKLQNKLEQECIPVGCVPPSSRRHGGGRVCTRHPPSAMALWCGGLLLWPSTPPKDHTRRPPSIRRPPNQKAITEGHNRRPHQPPPLEQIPLGADPPVADPPGADPPPETCCKACWDTTRNVCWDSTSPC